MIKIPPNSKFALSTVLIQKIKKWSVRGVKINQDVTKTSRLVVVQKVLRLVAVYPRWLETSPGTRSCPDEHPSTSM
jgi:hypothetical protein